METLGSFETNDGSFYFGIDSDDYVDGSDYRIKISGTGITVEDYSEVFTIECESEQIPQVGTIAGFNPFLILSAFFLISIFFARKIKRKL